MTSLRKLIDRPVVDRANATTLGSLAGMTIDVENGAVQAWQIGKGRKARFVDHLHIVGVGDAAMLIDDAANLRQPEDDHEHATVKGKLAALGHRAISDAGDDLGTIFDVDIDLATGYIRRIETPLIESRGRQIRGFGAYALVLGGPDGAAE